MPGKLGRLNSGRNPRRTAITAAALMVGIALVTGVTVIFVSAKGSITALAQDTRSKPSWSSPAHRAGPGPDVDPSVLDQAGPCRRAAVAGEYGDWRGSTARTRGSRRATTWPRCRDLRLSHRR